MKKKDTVQSLERGITGFEMVLYNGFVCPSELAARLNINRSSAYRLLTTLEDKTYIWQSSENKKFYPSYERIHALLPGAWDWLNLAENSLQTLCEQTGRTANIGIMEGSNIVYLKSLMPTPDDSSFIHPGTRNPAYATALGKAILAYKTETSHLSDYIELGLIEPSKRFPIDAKTLSEHLTQIRHNEYAIDDEDFAPNVRCIAAPIFDSEHTVVAAIGISGTVSNITTQMLPGHAQQVIEAAKRISMLLQVANYVSKSAQAH